MEKRLLVIEIEIRTLEMYKLNFFSQDLNWDKTTDDKLMHNKLLSED